MRDVLGENQSCKRRKSRLRAAPEGAAKLCLASPYEAQHELYTTPCITHDSESQSAALHNQ